MWSVAYISGSILHVNHYSQGTEPYISRIINSLKYLPLLLDLIMRTLLSMTVITLSIRLYTDITAHQVNFTY